MIKRFKYLALQKKFVSFIRAKFINGDYYYYLVESKREAGRIYQHIVEFLGKQRDAENYAAENKLKMPQAALKKPVAFDDVDRQISERKKRFDSLRKNPLLDSIVLEDLAVVWTYNSTAIEGSTLNLNETYLLLNDGIATGNKRLEDYIAAKGHKNAVNKVFEWVKNGKKRLSEKDVLQLHALVMEGIVDVYLVGRYRDVQVWIRNSSYTPPPASQVSKLMKAFIKNLNKDRNNVEPVALAARAHVDFESIHPFADGNGRVGRLISNWVLMSRGFPPIVIQNSEKKKYFSALEDAQKRHEQSRITYLFKKKTIQALEFYLNRLEKKAGA